MLIQLCLTDDVIPAPPPNRGDPSPGRCSRSEPRASDNWKGFCWVAAAETIIIRVLPLLDYNREYNISCLLHTGPAPGSGPAIWFKLWKKDKCSGDYQNYPVQSANAYRGVDSYLSLSCLLVFFNRRGFSHQRFHSDALISFDSQSDLCLGSSLPIWILMLSHHLDYH